MSPELQEAICNKLNETSQQKVLKWLRDEFEIHTSAAALSEFYSWYSLQQDLEKAANFAEDLKDTLKDLPNLTLDEDTINQAAQIAFELKAAQEKDSKLFMDLRYLRLSERDARTRAKFKERELELKERRIRLLEKKAAQAEQAESVTKSNLTPEEKEQRYKEIFGLK